MDNAFLDMFFGFDHNGYVSLRDGEKSFFEKEREELEKLEQQGAKRALKLYDFGVASLRAEIKKHPAQYFFLFLVSFLGSVITSSVALFGFSGTIIAQFASPQLQAKAEQPAAVSKPKVVETEKYDHQLLASKLTEGEDDFVIVDTRVKEEYDKGHIVTAINIPVYESEMVTKEGNLDGELVAKAFARVRESEKVIIIYGPNGYATLPGDIAALLNKEGVSAKPLAVGWEEWEHLHSN